MSSPGSPTPSEREESRAETVARINNGKPKVVQIALDDGNLYVLKSDGTILVKNHIGKPAESQKWSVIK